MKCLHIGRIKYFSLLVLKMGRALSMITLYLCQERMASPKQMYFQKSSKRPLTPFPPPSFLENHVALFKGPESAT